MACTRERESLKGTDYVLHVVLLVVVVTDDHNMDCVHDVKHTYRFFTRFYSQAFFYLLFNRPKLILFKLSTAAAAYHL